MNDRNDPPQEIEAAVAASAGKCGRWCCAPILPDHLFTGIMSRISTFRKFAGSVMSTLWNTMRLAKNGMLHQMGSLTWFTFKTGVEVTLSIAAIVLVTAVGPFLVWGTYEWFFRDGTLTSDTLQNQSLLGIIGVLTTVALLLSWIFLNIVRRDIRGELDQLARDERASSLAISAHTSAYVLWLQHFSYETVNENAASEIRSILLEQAIHLEQFALSKARNIENSQMYKAAILSMKSNLAFYLACKGETAADERDSAYYLAREGFEGHNESSEYAYSAYSTWAFVLYRLFGSEKWAKPKIVAAIKHLLETKGETHEESLLTQVWKTYAKKQPTDALLEIEQRADG